jgi:hypothetical protein
VLFTIVLAFTNLLDFLCFTFKVPKLLSELPKETIGLNPVGFHSEQVAFSNSPAVHHSNPLISCDPLRVKWWTENSAPCFPRNAAAEVVFISDSDEETISAHSCTRPQFKFEFKSFLLTRLM